MTIDSMPYEKKCRRCKSTLPVSSFMPDRLGRFGVGSTCRGCLNVPQKTLYQKAKSGEIQLTLTQEKKKAYARDRRCIISGCPETRYTHLDFHHVFWKSSERIRGEERNLADKGVMLCRRHHRQLTDGNVELDTFVRLYLSKHGKVL